VDDHTIQVDRLDRTSFPTRRQTTLVIGFKGENCPKVIGNGPVTCRSRGEARKNQRRDAMDSHSL
jgi:hypothetical protein